MLETLDPRIVKTFQRMLMQGVQSCRKQGALNMFSRRKKQDAPQKHSLSACGIRGR